MDQWSKATSRYRNVARALEDFRAGVNPISAKLFCKCSRVAFMPYGVVLKDERRTSNIERPTSNENTNTQYRTFNSYFFFFSAVLILVTKILINSSVSCKISCSSSGFLMSGTRWISFNHLWVSLSSFNEIRSLWIKSFGDSAAWALVWVRWSSRS